MALLIKNLNGLAYASVKSRSGLAVASIKNINGLDATAAAGPSLIAHTALAGTGPTSAIDTTGANLLVIAVSTFKSNTSVSDNKSNTWTPLTRWPSSGGGDNWIRLFYCHGGTVGTGHTFSVTSGDAPSLAVYAFSNIAASPFDQENGSHNLGSQTTISTGSITPSQANTVLISALCTYSNDFSTATIDNGFTFTDSARDVFNMTVAIAYKIVTSASATNVTWTYPAGVGGGFAASITSFKY